jgi:hypothetical protein
MTFEQSLPTLLDHISLDAPPSIPFLHIRDFLCIHLSHFCPGPSTPVLFVQPSGPGWRQPVGGRRNAEIGSQ